MGIGGLFNPVICVILPVVFYICTCFLIERKIPIWQWIILSFFLVLSVLVTVVSTMQNVERIIDMWSQYGAPFACHCHDIWKTCECGADRMTHEMCALNGTPLG